ncbi:MAG: monovalent cation/H+ antiporter complex subunit F [Spirochaetales bacterium]|nr:monovalent cation/H+ antiporter complex subunit F [Spirochaetales bacterium]
MTQIMLQGMQIFFLFCAALCVLRFILGPSTPDRLVALNVLSGVTLGFLVVRGVAEGRVLYLDVALVYDIFGFLGFLAIARFLRDKLTGKGDE